MKEPWMDEKIDLFVLQICTNVVLKAMIKVNNTNGNQTFMPYE